MKRLLLNWKWRPSSTSKDSWSCTEDSSNDLPFPALITLFSESCTNRYSLPIHTISSCLCNQYFYCMYLIFTFNCCFYMITVRFTEANKKCFREICFRGIEWSPNIYFFHSWFKMSRTMWEKQDVYDISLNWVNLLKRKWIVDWLSLLLIHSHPFWLFSLLASSSIVSSLS